MERINATVNPSKDHLQETQAINRSLQALGRVVNSLSSCHGKSKTEMDRIHVLSLSSCHGKSKVEMDRIHVY